MIRCLPHARAVGSARTIADFDKAIALRSHFASAYVNRGAAYENKGDNE